MGVLKELHGKLIDIKLPSDRWELQVNALLRDSCIDRKVLKVVVPLPKVGMLARRTVAACSGVTDENAGVVGGVSSLDSTEV